jgi:hypothetical protein
MRYTTRPLSDRTWLRPASKREWSRFDTTWSKTLQLLSREIDMLGGRDVVIEVDVPEKAIRLDGMLRADAKAASPAVVVAFESKHGPMLYRCDRFVARWSGQPADWQQNVRAIALTLESLRAVDRYGATETGQQYAGWKAIGSTPAAVPLATEAAWATLRNLAEVSAEDDVSEERIISLARRHAHPDHSGSAETWAAFDEAYKAVRS